MKSEQDGTMDSELHYIRYAEEISDHAHTSRSDDDDDNSDSKEPFRLVICMSKESSWWLAWAQYLQSDIAFKHVTGFLEFEIGGSDPNAKIGC